MSSSAELDTKVPANAEDADDAIRRREIFKASGDWAQLDEDGDGVIDKAELRRGLRRMYKVQGVPDTENAADAAADFLMKQLDTDKDGVISYQEANIAKDGETGALKKALASLNIDREQLKEIIRFAFDRFDEDGNGRIDMKEFLSAAKLLGMHMNIAEATIVFQSLSGKEDYIDAKDVSSAGWNSLGDALSKAMQKQYSKKGLSKFDYVFENVQNILEEDTTWQQKWDKFGKLLASQQENIADLAEFFVDIAGVAFAVSGISHEFECYPNCEEEIDLSNIAPFVFFLFISTRDFGKHLKDNFQADLDGSTALAYTQVFKPAGITIDDFIILNEQGASSWRELRCGDTLKYNELDEEDSEPTERLALVVNGEVEVVQEGLLGFGEDIAVLRPGSFVGAVQFLSGSDSDSAPSAMGKEYFVATRDTLLLMWDAKRLGRFLRTDDTLNQRVRGLVANSIVADVSQMKKYMVQRTGEHRELFESFTRSIQSKIKCERATMWIYRDDQEELWTLLMNSKHTEFFISVSTRNGGLAACAFQNQNSLVVPDCYADPRFNRDVDRSTGFVTRNMLCAPIPGRKPGQPPIAVLQFINKIDGNGKPCDFTEADCQTAQEVSWPLVPAIETIFKRGKRYHLDT